MAQEQFSLSPIGYIRSPREDLSDDSWGKVEARLELAERFAAEVFDGLEQFSHVEVIFVFHRVAEEEIELSARHPRENPDWPKVGIFAQRGKTRPNRLGVSMAKLVRREGRTLVLRGLDAVDGTPVLDVKPVMAEFLPRGEVHQPAWSHKLMSKYWE